MQRESKRGRWYKCSSGKLSDERRVARKGNACLVHRILVMRAGNQPIDFFSLSKSNGQSEVFEYRSPADRGCLPYSDLSGINIFGIQNLDGSMGIP